MTTVIVIVKRVVQEEVATKRGVEAGIMEALGIVKGTALAFQFDQVIFYLIDI